MAEVHIIGSLVGATEFPKPELCCNWTMIAGDDWTVVEGDISGQTQVDIPAVNIFNLGSNHYSVEPPYWFFSSQIDIHYTTSAVIGWPKITVQVFHQDYFGRNELCT